MLRFASVALALAALAACTLDWDDISQAGMNLPPLPPSSTGSTGGDVTPTTTDADASTTTTAADTTGAADETLGTDTGDMTADGSTGDTADEIQPPEIVDVAMPNPVKVAGPASFTVTTANATNVRAKLDGVELEPLTSEGAGVFAGAVPIYGSVDNGAHVLEVIAENEGPASDARSVQFDVATPAPGLPAWAEYGPPGSSTTRLALTAEGDVIEAGSLEVAGVSRPAIRKRAGSSGALMWADGTKVIDDRQGSVVGVAVTPDGRMWAAMNIRDDKLWRAHFVLLDAEGEPTGAAMNSPFGATVTAIASDGEGGFFAVGYTPTGFGDYDVAVWRVNKDLLPIFTAAPWDYVPQGQDWKKNTFTDLAFDVVVQGDVAWIAGMSQGKHKEDDPNAFEARGLIVRINIDTFAVLGPVSIAPEHGAYTQSFHNGIAVHSEGALVASQGCDATCTNQRIEVALYSDSGVRLWHKFELSGPVAAGRAVAANKHGLALVAAAMRDGQVLRGRMLSRVVHEAGDPLLDVWFPNQSPSATSSVVVGDYDEAFWGGYVTVGGVQRAYTVRLHQ
jgi:hypothetical protein